MTAIEFIRQCESGFLHSTLTDDQVAIYMTKLRVFSGSQLAKIYEKILETCMSFPKISHIYATAAELGFFEAHNPSDEFKPHRWEPADCEFCAGEGELSVIFDWFYETRDDRRVETERINRIFPYSSHDRIKYKLSPTEYERIERCSCAAGSAKTIPGVIKLRIAGAT